MNETGKAVPMRRVFALILLLCLIIPPVPISHAADGDTLTIAMLQSAGSNDIAFQTLVNRYMDASGSTVKIKYYNSVDDLNAVMNTELLAGKGPDLIQGADMPYWSLAERGVFCDIAELIENDPDVDMDNFLPNIIEPLMNESGELYIMPASFGFLYVMLNDALLEKSGLGGGEWTLQRLMDDCVDFTGMSGTFPNTYAMSWGNEYLSAAVENELMSAVDLENKTSSFGELDDLIFKYIHDPGVVSSENGFGMSGLVGIYDISPYLYFTLDMRLEPHVTANTMILFENSMYEVRNFPRSAYKTGEFLYTPKLAFCINASGNKDGAWDFMKYLLSDEVQAGQAEPLYIIDNPVNIRAAESRMELIRGRIAEQAEIKRQGGQPDGRLPGSIHGADEYSGLIDRYLDIYKELRGNLTTPVLSDANLNHNLISAISGTPSLNIPQARREIARIVGVYFGEESGDTSRGYTVIYIAAGVAAAGILAFVVAGRLKGGKRKGGA